MLVVIARFASNSERVHQRKGSPARFFAFGPRENEGLDIYSPSSVDGNSPINVFINGGTWRSGEAKDYAFPAEMLNAAGARFVPIDFDSVHDQNRDLMPMVS